MWYFLVKWRQQFKNYFQVSQVEHSGCVSTVSLRKYYNCTSNKLTFSSINLPVILCKVTLYTKRQNITYKLTFDNLTTEFYFVIKLGVISYFENMSQIKITYSSWINIYYFCTYKRLLNNILAVKICAIFYEYSITKLVNHQLFQNVEYKNKPP